MRVLLYLDQAMNWKPSQRLNREFQGMRQLSGVKKFFTHPWWTGGYGDANQKPEQAWATHTRLAARTHACTKRNWKRGQRKAKLGRLEKSLSVTGIQSPHVPIHKQRMEPYLTTTSEQCSAKHYAMHRCKPSKKPGLKTKTNQNKSVETSVVI